MAHEAEQINIQVGECSAHMLGPIGPKGSPLLLLLHDRELVAFPISALVLELTLSLSLVPSPATPFPILGQGCLLSAQTVFLSNSSGRSRGGVENNVNFSFLVTSSIMNKLEKRL